MIKNSNNELAITDTNSDISTVLPDNLYREITHSANYSLSIYSDIIKDENVPIEIKAQFADICAEREKTIKEIAVLFIGGIILVSAFNAIEKCKC